MASGGHRKDSVEDLEVDSVAPVEVDLKGVEVEAEVVLKEALAATEEEVQEERGDHIEEEERLPHTEVVEVVAMRDLPTEDEAALTGVASGPEVAWKEATGEGEHQEAGQALSQVDSRREGKSAFVMVHILSVAVQSNI